MTPAAYLANVPDWSDWATAQAWVDAAVARVRSAQPADIQDFACLDGAELCPPDALWRRWVLATFAADLACYPAPVDQVSFCRLARAMHLFPKGFSLYFGRDASGQGTPLGYCGWLPIWPATFAQFHDHPAALADRAIAPAPLRSNHAPYLYIFNYSVPAQLRGTPLSRALVQHMVAGVAACQPAGLATIAVSADGRRIAERWGMQVTASVQVGDGTEHVLATPRDRL